jgi:hypothetical protein
MNTLTSKLTAFAAALAMNGLILGALGYLFTVQPQPATAAMMVAKAAVVHLGLG